MKRRFISLICALFIFLSFANSFTAYAVGNQYYYVAVKTCEVRSAESPSASILTTISAGTWQLDFNLDYASHVWRYGTAFWSPVLFGTNTCGHIQNDSVCPLSSAMYVSTTSGLCLRPSPTLSSPSTNYLSYNNIVATLGHSSYADGYLWYEIRVMTGVHKGKTGWVAAMYLSNYAH